MLVFQISAKIVWIDSICISFLFFYTIAYRTEVNFLSFDKLLKKAYVWQSEMEKDTIPTW